MSVTDRLALPTIALKALEKRAHGTERLVKIGADLWLGQSPFPQLHAPSRTQEVGDIR